MKLHLPIALLTALVLCNAAYANGVYTVKESVSVESGSVSLSNEENGAAILNKLGTAAVYQAGDNNPAAVVKQGAGELVIDKDVNMNNPFVIDEGSVVIKDATVSSYRSNANATSGLSIGGANLTLDNGHYTQTGSAVYAMCIGNRDGAANLVLENGSTMQNTHFIFAGYTHSSAEDYRVGVDATPADAYATSTIKVLSGSKLTAGTSYQFANVNVLVEGAGSVMADNGVNKDGGNVWPDSYFGAGYERDVDINVTKGGALDLNWNAYTGMGHSSNVLINITGVDAETGTASSLDVAGILYLSSTGDYRDSSASAGSNYDTLTTLNITEGAKANVNQLVMGMDAGKADVTVGSGSTYTGKTMLVGANGSFTNNGTTTLTGGKVTEWYTDDVKVYGKQTVTKEGDLNIAGGKVSNNGTMEVQKLNMTSGTVLNDNTNEATTANGTLDNNGKLTVQKSATLHDANITQGKGKLVFGSSTSSKATLDIQNSVMTAKKDGDIEFMADVSVKDSKLVMEQGGEMWFKQGSTVKLNGGAELINNGGSSDYFIFASDTVITSNGNNSIKGGITMGTPTHNAKIVVESGVLDISSKEGTSDLLRLTNLYIADNASTGTKINVTANRGYLYITGDATISNLSINGATTNELTGNVSITDSLSINATPNYQYGLQSYDFKGEFNVLDSTQISIEDGAQVSLKDISVTATEFSVESAVLDNLLGAENITLQDNATITVAISQEYINQLSEASFNGREVTLSLTLLSDEISQKYAADDLAALMSAVEVDFSNFEANNGFEIVVDDTTGEYKLTATATIPEPTTATLSLLALASLAMRRRRK